MHYLSHITTLYLIALLHYSHSHPASLTADPHDPSDPGATMVVLCKRLYNILTSLVRKPKLAASLMHDSQHALTPRHTCSIEPINQVTSCWILHTWAHILLVHPNNSSHPAPYIRWLITITLKNRYNVRVGLTSHTLLYKTISHGNAWLNSIYNMYIAFVTNYYINIYIGIIVI